MVITSRQSYEDPSTRCISGKQEQQAKEIFLCLDMPGFERMYQVASTGEEDDLGLMQQLGVIPAMG